MTVQNYVTVDLKQISYIAHTIALFLGVKLRLNGSKLPQLVGVCVCRKDENSYHFVCLFTLFSFLFFLFFWGGGGDWGLGLFVVVLFFWREGEFLQEQNLHQSHPLD